MIKQPFLLQQLFYFVLHGSYVGISYIFF